MADQEEHDPRGMAIPVVWVGAEDLPVHLVNQFLGQVQGNEVFLTFGTLVPPPIIGDSIEERRAQVESLSFVPVKPIARLGLTLERLQELIAILQETVANYERQRGAQP